jgi:uncharacterized membrane protein YfcA
MLVLTLLLSITVGLALGALGGGGSTLTVPILTYAGGLEPQSAIASALLVVAATSTIGAASHARAGRVSWRTALAFGPAGMAGAYAGGRLAELLPGRAALVVFAITMCATALAMLLRSGGVAHGRREIAPGRAIVVGFVVGMVTGTIGTGGGFLIVPALVLLAHLPIEAAVGTSLVVIGMQSFAGFVGRLGHVTIDWPLTIAVAAIASVASLAGRRIACRLPPAGLQRVFAYFILVTAVAMLVVELVR